MSQKDVTSANPELKTIGELAGRKFLIPPYQRGYRWTREQVGELLDDIAQFKPSTDEEFYCLQPVVVRRAKDADQWEVIDGQQRLTTLYLIQHILGKVAPYELNFETAKRQIIGAETLAAAVAGNTKVGKDDPLEASYLKNAADFVQKWKKPAELLIEAFLHKLREKTQIIWYEIAADGEQAQAVFARLNAGKIPLTQAELVKALLLQRPATAPAATAAERREIAADWNGIEAELARPELWGWLRPSGIAQGQPRIEWLLRQWRVQQPVEVKTSNADLFKVFEQQLTKKPPFALWQEVKCLFQQLLGWFEDPDLYHRVGYLRHSGEKMTKLFELAKSHAKQVAGERDLKIVAQKAPVAQADFLETLAQRIRELAGFPDGDPDTEWNDLRYNVDNYRLHRILLLHNVGVAWQAGDRFPFHRYGAEKWSLEHIHPQNPEPPATPEARATWVKNAADVVAALQQPAPAEAPTNATEEVRAEAARRQADHTALLTNSAAFEEQLKKYQDPGSSELPLPEAAERERLQPLLNAFADLAGEQKDRLANLALLSRDHNAALNNGTFPVKRAKVLGLVTPGNGFVPPATRAVFLKAFTRQPDQLLLWSAEDGRQYQAAIRQSVRQFLTAPQIARYAND